jgi:hypothetical protein
MAAQPPVVEWLDPWEPTDGFHYELAREVAPGHPLFGVRAVAVARRCDSDDVLFLLNGVDALLAVVHLTWSGHEEPPPFPETELFADWDQFTQGRMVRDHRKRPGT